MRPLFRELGIDAFAEPGLPPAPAQALLEQDLVDPAAPHGDALVLRRMGREPVQGPRREGQTQAARAGQRGGDHGGDLVRRVGRRAAGAGVVVEGGEALGIEAANAATHRLRVQPERGGDGGRRLAPAGAPDDAGALDPPRRRRPRAGQGLDRRAFLERQVAQADRRATQGTSPVQERPPSYRITCRMNH
jgi:hypothetical protein